MGGCWLAAGLMAVAVAGGDRADPVAIPPSPVCHSSSLTFRAEGWRLLRRCSLLCEAPAGKPPVPPRRLPWRGHLESKPSR